VEICAGNGDTHCLLAFPESAGKGFVDGVLHGFEVGLAEHLVDPIS